MSLNDGKSVQAPFDIAISGQRRVHVNIFDFAVWSRSVLSTQYYLKYLEPQ